MFQSVIVALTLAWDRVPPQRTDKACSYYLLTSRNSFGDVPFILSKDSFVFTKGCFNTFTFALEAIDGSGLGSRAFNRDESVRCQVENRKMARC
jgi:hypothetical protein